MENPATRALFRLPSLFSRKTTRRHQIHPSFHRPVLEQQRCQNKRCPFPECTYKMDNVEDTLAAVLIAVHSAGTHTASAAAAVPTSATTAKVKKVQRPTFSAADSSEEWSYFLTYWHDYIKATKVKGKDQAVQLLDNEIQLDPACLAIKNRTCPWKRYFNLLKQKRLGVSYKHRALMLLAASTVVPSRTS